MKHLIIIFLAALGILFLANWGTPESSLDQSRKAPLNFYGTLDTWQGQTYPVENISLDHKVRKIEMYEKPTDAKSITPSTTNEPATLSANPITSFAKVYVDLSEIKSLEITNPENIWSYKKKRANRELAFLEIVITNNDETQTTYLIENRKKLYCDRRIGESLEEREVPLIAVKKLSVQGFHHRDPKPGKNPSTYRERMPAETQSIAPIA